MKSISNLFEACIRLRKMILAERFDLYKDEIRERNCNGFNNFAIVGLLISIAVITVGYVLSNYVTFNAEFTFIFCYFLVLLLVSKIYYSKHNESITIIFYLAISPLMIIGILMGTFFDRTEPSITIMVFICVLPLFILDKTWRIILYITGVSVVYCICCYIAKDYNMFIADLIDLLIFYSLAVGINYFILNERIDSVENYVSVKHKSEVDQMTGIYNRGTGTEKITNIINREIYGAFIMLDIDNLKSINDNYGHMCGDDAIHTIAKLIKKCFNADDIVLRMGGDEFIIYSINSIDAQKCTVYLDKLLNEIKVKKLESNEKITLSISAGCAIYNEGVSDFNKLYKISDKCLYKAKRMGKGIFIINR